LNSSACVCAHDDPGPCGPSVATCDTSAIDVLDCRNSACFDSQAYATIASLKQVGQRESTKATADRPTRIVDDKTCCAPALNSNADTALAVGTTYAARAASAPCATLTTRSALAAGPRINVIGKASALADYA
jgi:hypothetical protein